MVHVYLVTVGDKAFATAFLQTAHYDCSLLMTTGCALHAQTSRQIKVEAQ